MVKYKKDETEFKLAIWKTGQPQYLVTVPKVLIDRLKAMNGTDRSTNLKLLEGSELVYENGTFYLVLKTEPKVE